MPAPRNESSTPVCAFFAASSSRWRIELHLGQRRRHVELASRSGRPRGICSKRSSIEETPIAASISSRSRSVSERYPSVIARPRPPVRLDVEQVVDLGRIGQPDPHEPALAVRVVVDRLRLVDRLLVHLEDLARQRRDHVRDRLHRLDLAVGLVLDGRAADRRRLEVDELAERVLRPPGDAEHRLVTLDPRPVVLGVVLQVFRVALCTCHLALLLDVDRLLDDVRPLRPAADVDHELRVRAPRRRPGRTPSRCRRRASASACRT